MQSDVPKPLDVRVEFFRAQRSSGSNPTPWEGLATRGVDLRQIVASDINHETMMREPYVQMLAEQLMRALDSEPATSQQGRSPLPFGSPVGQRSVRRGANAWGPRRGEHMSNGTGHPEVSAAPQQEQLFCSRATLR